MKLEEEECRERERERERERRQREGNFTCQPRSRGVEAMAMEAGRDRAHCFCVSVLLGLR
jgi:hypothetical protein